MAGDVGGIEEASSAMVEGYLAGLNAAASLGYGGEQVEQQRHEFETQLNDLRSGQSVRKFEPDLPTTSIGGLLNMLQVTGIPTKEDVAKVTPPLARLQKGPCAVIECFQKIPCNPCATSCPFGAIERGNDINELPVINWDICTGCGICVVNCPGLAIFVVDLSQPDKAVVKLPYEFLPLPKVGETVTAIRRDGTTLEMRR